MTKPAQPAPKRKATKQAKPPANIQYLVLYRTTLDDLPMLLTPNAGKALEYAARIPFSDVVATERVFGIDNCSPVNSTVVKIAHGRPVESHLVCDYNNTPAPGDTKKAKKAKR